jgi:hypothetical protein
MPSINVANITMPSEKERAERKAIHDRLDRITLLLMDSDSQPKP